MVKIEEIPRAEERPERPWLHIREATTAQEDAIRWYADLEGFPTLRGYWAHLKTEDWDYYNVLRAVSPTT